MMAKPFVATLFVGLCLIGTGDPASVSAAPSAVCDAVWRDGARAREIPVRVRVPEASARAPVILFSHGLGGSVNAGTRWAKAWVDAGFAVVHVQHPGSDREVLRAAPLGRKRAALTRAISAEQLIARIADMTFVMDRLAASGAGASCAEQLQHVDAGRVGIAGHSFGARTVQALAGQRFPKGDLADPRARAAIAFSPAPDRTGDDSAFGAIAIPFFSITGTADASPLFAFKPEDRARPFRAMPAGDKFLLVYAGGNHADFSGQTLPGRSSRASPRIAADVAEVTTLFWKATLLGDAVARQRLVSRGGGTFSSGDFFQAR